MRRGLARGAAFVAALVLCLLAAGCDGEAPFAPSLPSAAGYRFDGGGLQIWTGAPCQGVTRVALTFEGPGDARHRIVLRAPEPGVMLEHLDPLRPDDAFTIEEALPASFDWTTADALSLVIDAEPPAWGSRVDVHDLVAQSPEHPAGSYLFDDLGWKDPSEVAAEDGSSFLTVCAQDPGRDSAQG